MSDKILSFLEDEYLCIRETYQTMYDKYMVKYDNDVEFVETMLFPLRQKLLDAELSYYISCFEVEENQLLLYRIFFDFLKKAKRKPFACYDFPVSFKEVDIY